jgi:hypothetical protein
VHAGEPTFVVVPCSLECTYYRYVVEESGRQRKPLRFEVES